MGHVQKHNPNQGSLIRTKESKDITDTLDIIIKKVCTDLNITEPQPGVKLTIYRMVQDKYGHFTFSEIKEAFTLNLYGDLDRFFYQNLKGKPDNDPFGAMSAKFFSAVMNAYSRYRQHKASTPGTNVVALLPEKVYTQKQKDEIHANYVREICNWFENDMPDKPFPYITSEFNYKLFLELGLVPEWGLTQLKKEYIRPKEVNLFVKSMGAGCSMLGQYGALILQACMDLKKQGKSLRKIMSDKYGMEI